ncbi:MAG: zinc ribbon domain-containing protein [Oscillospiraceae bacterium]|nr:zinc ribbon domain-containing protein [Oscillospiraceae bacterium]
MYCGNCGAELTEQTNFCPYCGSRLQNATPSMSLYNKASSAARSTNVYNLVLVSTGTLDRISAGDLLEDVFGYTDEESSNLISMMPVVVGENLTSQEATTVAQMFTEYGMEVSITDKEDKYVDLTGNAKTSVFDSAGKLLSSAAAIIGALTVANRITTYRRYKRPSLIERLFRIAYKPYPPVYRRYFRPYIVTPKPAPPRRTIRKPAPIHRTPMMSPGPNGHNRLNGLGPGVANAQRKPGNPTGNRHPGNPGGNKGPGGGKGGPGRKH